MEIEVREGCACQEACGWLNSIERPANGSQEQAQDQDGTFYAVNGTCIEKLGWGGLFFAL